MGKGKWHVRVSVVFVDDEPLEDVGTGAGGGWSGVGGDLQGANPSETPCQVLSGSPHLHLRPARGIKLCSGERRRKKGKAGEGNGRQS